MIGPNLKAFIIKYAIVCSFYVRTYVRSVRRSSFGVEEAFDFFPYQTANLVILTHISIGEKKHNDDRVVMKLTNSVIKTTLQSDD